MFNNLDNTIEFIWPDNSHYALCIIIENIPSIVFFENNIEMKKWYYNQLDKYKENINLLNINKLYGYDYCGSVFEIEDIELHLK